MADVAPAQQPIDPEAEQARERDRNRHRLARIVVLGSFLTIFLLVGALLAIGQSGSPTEIAQNTFNTVLPVLAGWVGTVLAFYFSAQSLERTSNTLDRAIASQTAARPLGPVDRVSENMIPIGSIRGSFDLSRQPPNEIFLSEIERRFKEGEDNQPITRLIFLENKVFRYILHASALSAFLLNIRPPAEREKLTFADLLADPETAWQISKLVAVVSASATLGEAKSALESVTGAQDIIVTASGKSNEPMLGWITNVDLVKLLSAR
jgi:hypothetical protein